jgi:rubrerythrin
VAATFSAREIVEAAVEKERKRRDFYASVTALSTNEEMKGLFRFLTEEEERHIATFVGIRDNVPVDAQSDEYSADMEAYMDSMIDDRLYSEIDSERFVQEAIDTKDVFRLAIGFEKDAILYFREFLPYLAESEKKVVADLIEQEKAHIRKLAEMKRTMGV